MTKLALKQELRESKKAKGMDLAMLSSLKGKVLYIDEGEGRTPYIGKLVEYGENLLKFVDVRIFQSHHTLHELDGMRRKLEEGKEFGQELTKIPVLYKNRTHIATLIELYPKELLRKETESELLHEVFTQRPENGLF